MRAMRTAASGMFAQKLNVDNIANNLANISTNGFKKARLEFQDVLYEVMRMAGASSETGIEVPVELQIGYGTKPSATERIYSQGNLVNTNNPLDLAIQGDGFFMVELPDGTTAFTRDGAFKLSKDGDLVTTDGYPLSSAITVPPEAVEVSIGVDGTVTVRNSGETDVSDVGQITLAKFPNPAGLEGLGRNLFMQTTASGDYVEAVPGESGLGLIRSGYVESSNVESVEEMVNLIIAQRSYEINSRAIQTSEDMMQIVNTLKR